MGNTKQPPAARLEKAGYTVEEWCRGVGVSRTKFYSLEGEMRPRCVMLGTRRIVAETPKEWLTRVAGLQAGRDAA